MTKIVSEDSTELSNARKSQQEATKLGLYVPQFHGLNQMLYTPSGSGAISYMDALGKMSSSAMQAQQDVYDRQETTQYLTDTETKFQKRMDEFERSNPSGKGIMEEAGNTYQELINENLNSASNSNVKQSLEYLSAQRMKDINNVYFQKENQISVSYALSDNKEKKNVILNNLINNPEQIGSFSQLYDYTTEEMKAILKPTEYQVYQQESKQQFAHTYGLALIKKDPYGAKDMLNGEYFTQNLSPEHRISLENKVRTEIDYREAKARQEKHELQQAQNAVSEDNYSNIKRLIPLGAISPNDIDDMYNRGQITFRRKNNALQKYNQHLESSKAQRETDEAIAKSKRDNTPLPNVSSEDKNKDFMTVMRNKAAADGVAPSLLDQTNYVKEHAMTYDTSITTLQHAIETTIKNSNDPKQLKDAALALYDKETTPALKGISDDATAFSYLAVNLAMANAPESDNRILELRNQFFPKEYNKAQHDYNASKWADSSRFGEALKNALPVKIMQDFEINRGFLSFHGDPMIYNEMISVAQNVAKTVFIKTGSSMLAETAAKEVLNTRYTETKINGLKGDYAYMPVEKNSKFNQTQIQNRIALTATMLITDIQESISKNTYTGVKIRMPKDAHLLTKPINEISENEILNGSIVNSQNKYKKESSDYNTDHYTENSKFVEVEIDGKYEPRRLCVYHIKDNNYGLYIWSTEDVRENMKYKIPILNPHTGTAVVVQL